jgi:putative SOS response-associated peptidase YedK
MCNLFAVRASAAEVASHFGAESPAQIAVPAETVRGSAGLIVRQHAGRRLIKSLDWGFPRHTREMRERGEPPGRVNLVADLTNPMWSDLAQDVRYRCLIPLTHFAEPDGPKGKMTRTWYNIAGEPVTAWAGFCRNTEAFGPVFAGMTTDSNEAVSSLNPRMPVLLRPNDFEHWLHGSIKDVIGFQFRKFPSERLQVEATDELWRGGAVRRHEPALL